MQIDSDRFSRVSSFIYNSMPSRIGWSDLVFELVAIACGVLLVAVLASTYLTVKTAKKNNQSIWDKSSQLLLANMMIPLAVGGVFGLILIKQDLFGLVAPVTLIFYGLALINASKYTLHDIRYLGFAEVILGLMNSASIGYGIFYWAIGFGVLHIIYGALMYFKYERK
jgi:hydrogenase-4 membrane subunit HyfE